MRKIFWTFLMFMGSLIVSAQTHTFPALDTNNAFTGADSFAQINTTLYAGNSPYTTIQQAVTAGCALSGNILVEVPVGNSSSTVITTLTGCTTVYIRDSRTLPATLYQYSSGAYGVIVPTQCSGSQFATGVQSNGTANCATPNPTPTPATSNVLKGNGSLNGVVAATPGTDYVVPAGNVATATALATNPALCTGVQLSTGIIAAGTAQCRYLTPADTGSVGMTTIGSALPAYPSVASAIAAGFTSLTFLPATSIGGFTANSSVNVNFSDYARAHMGWTIPEQSGATGSGSGTDDGPMIQTCANNSATLGTACYLLAKGGGYNIVTPVVLSSGMKLEGASNVTKTIINCLTPAGVGCIQNIGGPSQGIVMKDLTINLSATVTTTTGVSALTVNSAGSGILSGMYWIEATGGSGSGAEGQIDVSGGSVVTVAVTSSGSGYDSAPTGWVFQNPTSALIFSGITLTGNGTTATATTATPLPSFTTAVVNITGASISGYNGSNVTITRTSANTFTYTNSTTGSATSASTAPASLPTYTVTTATVNLAQKGIVFKAQPSAAQPAQAGVWFSSIDNVTISNCPAECLISSGGGGQGYQSNLPNQLNNFTKLTMLGAAQCHPLPILLILGQQGQTNYESGGATNQDPAQNVVNPPTSCTPPGGTSQTQNAAVVIGTAPASGTGDGSGEVFFHNFTMNSGLIGLSCTFCHNVIVDAGDFEQDQSAIVAANSTMTITNNTIANSKYGLNVYGNVQNQIVFKNNFFENSGSYTLTDTCYGSGGNHINMSDNHIFGGNYASSKDCVTQDYNPATTLSIVGKEALIFGDSGVTPISTLNTDANAGETVHVGALTNFATVTCGAGGSNNIICPAGVVSPIVIPVSSVLELLLEDNSFGFQGYTPISIPKLTGSITATSVTSSTCTVFTGTLTGLHSGGMPITATLSGALGAGTSIGQPYYSSANTAAIQVCAGSASNSNAVTIYLKAQ